MNLVCRYCAAKHWASERVRSSSVSNPEFGMCCDHGKVRLPLAEDPPDQLRELFTGNSPQAREFRDHIRQYNAAFAFTSLGVYVDETVNRGGGGPPVFKIGGELCHQAGSLLPPEGQTPRYSQLYIYDPRDALDHRMHNNPLLRRDTMETLQDTLLHHHRYAAIYKHAFEILSEHDSHDVTIRLCADKTRDRRRYNLPTADEIAVVIPGDETQPPKDPRDIILTKRNGPLQRISDAHPAYACLHYVLLFPHGTSGWSWDLQLEEPDKPPESRRRLTQSRFYSYQLHPRDTEFSLILRGGRLLQQYIVDAWASTDQNRLRFLAQNQAKLRAALYSGLEDAVAAADDQLDLNEVGKRVILPSSYIGGPRYMHQLFQDAMALARYFRRIDLFITVTCNP
ncbi:hypothetical protein BV25DRAFT_1864431, partial [Artomyces pyxidatus]